MYLFPAIRNEPDNSTPKVDASGNGEKPCINPIAASSKSQHPNRGKQYAELDNVTLSSEPEQEDKEKVGSTKQLNLISKYEQPFKDRSKDKTSKDVIASTSKSSDKIIESSEECNTIKVQKIKRNPKYNPAKFKQIVANSNLQGSAAAVYAENYMCDKCSFQCSHSCKDYFFSRSINKESFKVRHFNEEGSVKCSVCNSEFSHPSCVTIDGNVNKESSVVENGSVTYWSCKQVGCASKFWHTMTNNTTCYPAKYDKIARVQECGCCHFSMKHICQI